MPKLSEISKPFDPSEYLDSDETAAFYISEALATGDVAFIADSIGVVARAKSMSQIAQSAGLSRESLYKALSVGGNPELSTLLKVIKALGLELSALPARAPHPDEIEEQAKAPKAKAKPRARRAAKVPVEA